MSPEEEFSTPQHLSRPVNCRQFVDHSNIIFLSYAILMNGVGYKQTEHSDTNCSDGVLCTLSTWFTCTVYTCTPSPSLPLLHPPVSIAPPIQGSQKMDPEQLSSYLCLLDLPLQLNSSPHQANLALIQSRHLMRIPYQSRCSPVPPKY